MPLRFRAKSPNLLLRFDRFRGHATGAAADLRPCQTCQNGGSSSLSRPQQASSGGCDRRAGRWALQENRGVACSALEGPSRSRANRPAIGSSLTISAGLNRRLANGSARLRIVCSRCEGLSCMVRDRRLTQLQASEPNAPAQIYCNPRSLIVCRGRNLAPLSPHRSVRGARHNRFQSRSAW